MTLDDVLARAYVGELIVLTIDLRGTSSLCIFGSPYRNTTIYISIAHRGIRPSIQFTLEMEQEERFPGRFGDEGFDEQSLPHRGFPETNTH